MPPLRISLGSCQLMFVVTCFAPDAPASENAKAPEMKARRPKSSLPPMLGTESKYLFSLSRQPQDWGPAEASASLPALLEVWPLPSPECPVNYWRPSPRPFLSRSHLSPTSPQPAWWYPYMSTLSS